MFPYLRFFVLAALLLAPAALSQSAESATEQQLRGSSADSVTHRTAAPVAVGDPGTRRNLTTAEFALDPDRVRFDLSYAGQIWGGSLHYKMCFEAGGARFIPFLGSDAPHNFPLRFGAPTVTVDGALIPLSRRAEPSLHETRVQFDRGGMVEQYDLHGTHAEQSFRFDHLEFRGELEIVVPVATDLIPAARGGGIVFVGPHGGVTYSQAIAVDAAGERVQLETLSDGDGIRIRVPAHFVQKARLPLLVDPLLGSTHAIAGSSTGLTKTDIAYDAVNDVYLAVYAFDFSTSDSDVLAQRLHPTLQTLRDDILISAGDDAWENPRVASKSGSNAFLIVAQVSANERPPFRIMGEVVDAVTGLRRGRIAIADSALPGHDPGDKIHPDVGGDCSAGLPTYFTVVWERASSSGDHDIHMKQVAVSDTATWVRNASPTRIADSPTHSDIRPSISKSNGASLGFDRHWAVIWERELTSTNHDVFGSFVHWDGSLRLIGLSNEFVIDDTPRHDVSPRVSSPTDSSNGGVYLATFQGGPAGGDTDIYVRAVDLSGVVSPTTSLQALENAGPAQSWPQLAPSTDSDGCRFVVGYHELVGGTGTNTNVLLSLVGWNPAARSLIVNEARLVRAANPGPDEGVSVFADASGGRQVARPNQFVAIWINRTAPETGIEAGFYEGYAAAGGLSARATGCGSATLSATSSGILGHQANFRILAPGAAATAVLFGLPQAIDLSPICGGCVLGSDGTPYPAPLDVIIPCQPALVGNVAAFQGVAIYAGGQPCLSQISLTDTIDLTIR